MLEGTEYIKAGAFGCAADLGTDSLMASLSSLIAVRSCNHNNSLLNRLFAALTGLAFLAAYVLVGVLDALALIRLGGTLLTNICGKLSDLLLVGA